MLAPEAAATDPSRHPTDPALARGQARLVALEREGKVGAIEATEAPLRAERWRQVRPSGVKFGSLSAPREKWGGVNLLINAPTYVGRPYV